MKTILEKIDKNQNNTDMEKDLYTAIHVAPIVYQRYEYGHSPAFEQLIALADYFDVSLDYLVGRSDDPRRH